MTYQHHCRRIGGLVNNELERIQNGLVVDLFVVLPSKFAAGNEKLL